MTAPDPTRAALVPFDPAASRARVPALRIVPRGGGPEGGDPTTSVATPTRTDPPVMRVARPLADGVPGLGLDRPLPLLGGGRIGPGVLAPELTLDWLPGVIRFVEDACATRLASGERWLTMPPAALLGQAGTGRVHVARTIARLAGLPHYVLDVSGPRGLEALRPTVRPGSATLPSLPTLAMAASRCANPVVSVVGVGDAPAHALDLLMEVTDRSLARRWPDEPASAVVDLSQVSWFIGADEPAWRRLRDAPHVIPVEVREVASRHDDLLEFELLVLSVLDAARPADAHHPMEVSWAELVQSAWQVWFRTRRVEALHAFLVDRVEPPPTTLMARRPWNGS